MIDISYIKTQDNAEQACCTVNSGCRGLGFIGVAVGLIIGILIYSELFSVNSVKRIKVNAAIDCPAVGDDADGNAACERAKSIAWTVNCGKPQAEFPYYQLVCSSPYLPFLVDSAEQFLSRSDLEHDNFSHVKECNLNQSESVLNACDRAETFRGKVVI